MLRGLLFGVVRHMTIMTPAMAAMQSTLPTATAGGRGRRFSPAADTDHLDLAWSDRSCQ
jgi:hypothetical protein